MTTGTAVLTAECSHARVDEGAVWVTDCCVHGRRCWKLAGCSSCAGGPSRSEQ